MKKKKTNTDTAEKSPAEHYAARLYKFDSFYLQLIVCCAAVCAAAIAVAILANVFVGILASIAIAVVYFYFSSDELRRDLGIRASLCGSDLKLVSFKTLTGSEAFIPARLMWRDLTEIGCGAFDSKANAEIELLHIPSTVTRIENGALRGCVSLKKLLFECESLSSLTIEEDLSSYEIELRVPYPEKFKSQKATKEEKLTSLSEEKEYDSELYELPDKENATTFAAEGGEKETKETTE